MATQLAEARTRQFPQPQQSDDTSETSQLPMAAATASLAAHFGSGPMSPALAIMLDPVLFERAKQIAVYMSKAEGFTPPHLLGRSEACFAVVTRSLTWKLDPFGVAMSTYQTPGGRIGFEGKLCQAILENSGHLEGSVKFEHYGDWSRVLGKFAIRKSDKGKDYAALTWTREDAKGLGVMVRAKVRGEAGFREWPMDLEQCFPLNSTLWATDPKRQICYTAVRAFANIAAPGIMMGVPFDRNDWDDNETYQPEHARDVTPPENVRPESAESDIEPPKRRGRPPGSSNRPKAPTAIEQEGLKEKEWSASPTAPTVMGQQYAHGEDTIDHETGEVTETNEQPRQSQSLPFEE